MLAEFVIEKIERDRQHGTNSNNSLPGKYSHKISVMLVWTRIYHPLIFFC